MNARIILLIVIMILAGAAFFHFSGDAPSQAQAGGPGGPAPKVDVEILAPETSRVWNEFSGRLSAVDHVEVRPRVSGTITEVLFKEGSVVEKGAPLFVIDPRPYKASLDTANAALQAANSKIRLTKAELGRADALVKKKVISKSRFDSLQSDYKVALSDVNAARAQIDQAKLNLEYAHIKAAVSGRVSRAEMTVGNVVQAGANAPILTTIVSNDQLYAEFDVDEQTYLKLVRSKKDADMPVELILPSDESVIYEGEIHSFDNQLNPTSGTIRARAIFENKDGALVSGMYANIRLGSASEQSLLLVSKKAIGTDQNKKFVYVITAENKVMYREVKLGQVVGNKRIVLSGLETGEKVMINSLQRVMPNMVVEPIDIATKAATPPNAPPAQQPES